MIGFANGARIRALEDANADIAARLLTLSAQFASEMERAAAQQSETVRLRERVDALEATVADLEARFAGQAAALGALEADAAAKDALIEAQRAAIVQAQADIFRIDRQTASDFEEVRRTSAAIAEMLLLKRQPASA